MKKLIVGIFAAALMLVGLVGVTGTSAQAAACGYADACPATKTNADAPKSVKGKKAEMTVKVKAKSGDVSPKGTVKVVCKKGSKTAKDSAKVKNGKAAISLKLAKKGIWKCTAKFTGKNAKNSSDTFLIKRR